MDINAKKVAGQMDGPTLFDWSFKLALVRQTATICWLIVPSLWTS